MQQIHVNDIIDDYTLGLLSPERRTQLEAHIAVCPTCRQEVQEGRRLRQAIRSTLYLATGTGASQMRRLMPDPPPGRQGKASALLGPGRLAPLVAVLVLLVAGVGLFQLHPEKGGQLWAPALETATMVAATATVTDAPTATLADTDTARPGSSGMGNSDLALPTWEAPPTRQQATPAPNPTPVAMALPPLP